MFHFFVKKYFLADSLWNFVDIHNHILPGIDDGAKDLEASSNLIRGFEELGIRKFVATPHILQPLYPNTKDTIRKAHSRLMDYLMDQQARDISIEPSAEHMVDDSFEGLLKEDGILPFRKRYLLVEMSFLQPSLNFDEAILQVSRKGYYPILAHPERYLYLHHNKSTYGDFTEQGIHLQLNLLSLGEYYGTEVQKMAFDLLDEGMIDFVASDAHGPKHLEALKQIRLPRKRLQQVEAVIRNTIETFY